MLEKYSVVRKEVFQNLKVVIIVETRQHNLFFIAFLVLLINNNKFAIHIFSGCFEINTKSKGNKITGDKPSWKNVENATTCQVKYCQEYDKCKYFVYNEKTKSCNLKTGNAFTVRISSSGYVFGPKFCPGVCN